MFAIKVQEGSASVMDIDESASISSAQAKESLIWIHFNGEMEAARHWLTQHFSSYQESIDILCNEWTRPRILINEREEWLFTLRMLSEEESHGAISLRGWVFDGYLITIARTKTQVLVNAQKYILNHAKDIDTIIHLLCKLFNSITEDMSQYVMALDEQLNAVEYSWDTQDQLKNDELHSVRLDIAHFRRFILPQVEAYQKLSSLIAETRLSKKLKSPLLFSWRETVNTLQRTHELLLSLQERSAVLNDAFRQHNAELSNRIMYLLSVIATFFLPLTFITSLLGINVSGIPGSQHPWAFYIVCAFMGFVAVCQWILFKRWQWLK